MVNVFESILGFLESIVQIVINLYEGLATMLSLIPNAFGMLLETLSYIPAELTVFASVGVCVALTFMIAGR